MKLKVIIRLYIDEVTNSSNDRIVAIIPAEEEENTIQEIIKLVKRKRYKLTYIDHSFELVYKVGYYQSVIFYSEEYILNSISKHI